ncbi:MAG: hypothetical protein ACOYMR_01945 [Ilumatobacteraceae bacterium]
MTEPLRSTEPLHDDLVAISHWVDPVVAPAPELLDAHVVRGEEPRDGFPWRRGLMAAAAALLVFAGVWVVTRQDRDQDAFQPTPGDAQWVETAPSPLQARNDAQAVWTGSEFVVFAGTTQPECPVCDYFAYGETLHDAAAYDPVAGTWRTIAPLPDDASYVGQAAVAGGDVYWFSVRDPDTNASGIDATLYRYDPDGDAWTAVELPEDLPGPARITGVGDGLLLYPSTDETGDFADWVWSPAATDRAVVVAPGQWTRLPEDPFPRSYDRQYLDGGDRLLLFQKSLLTAQQSALPPVAQGAALLAGEWTVMPDSDQLVPPYVSDRTAAFAPLGGGADGGEVNNWGRTIPNGGGYDIAGNSWFALPAPVPEDLNGLLGDETSFLGGVRGHVLDRSTSTYLTVPALPDGLADGFGQALSAGDDRFFSFGGTTGGFTATDGTASPSPAGVHGRAFVWAPRAEGVVDTTVPGEVTETTTVDTTRPPATTITADRATAVWTWEAYSVPGPDDTELQLLVTRLSCSSGVTGEVLPADVVETADEVIITAWVKPLPAGDYECPGNDAVPYTVTLSEPLGGRSVVDGACLTGEASQTSYCENGGTRLGSEPTPTPSTADPVTTLADLTTEALCDEAIRLLDADGLSDPRQLVADLRALPTDSLSPAVAGGFKVAVDRFSAEYEASRGTLNGYDSEALSSFLTETCGRGEIPTIYVTP